MIVFGIVWHDWRHGAATLRFTKVAATLNRGAKPLATRNHNMSHTAKGNHHG